VDRDRFLLLVAALSACHAQEIHEVTVASVPSSPPSPPRDTTFCESLSKKNEALLAQPEIPQAALENRLGQCGEAEDKRIRALLVNPTERPAFLNYCHASQGGTWAVMLVSVSLDDPGGEGPPCGWAAAYKLVHVRDAVKTSGVATSSTREYVHWLNESDEYAVVRTIDYDHDGQDELVLSETKWQNGECAGLGEDCKTEQPADEVWTIGNKVTGYRPPASPSSK
jgi:hypothetical protein